MMLQTASWHVIFIHTHTGHCYGNIPASTYPLCLLCCYSSHPRIVSLFFSPASLPRVRDSQRAVETTVQLVSYSPFLPFAFCSYQRHNSLFWIISVFMRVCVCVLSKEAHTAGNSTKIADDELLWRWQISGSVTCALQDSVSWVLHTVISWVGFLLGSNLSMDTLSSQWVLYVHFVLRTSSSCIHRAPGAAEHNITCMGIRCILFNK